MDAAISDAIVKEGGYARFGKERFVGINRAKYDYEIPFEGFFETPETFDVTQSIKPLFFGVEYKDSGSPDFVKPEVTSDPTGDSDHDATLGSVAESIPFADDANPIFTHSETTEGIHEYALYGINWFSRPSMTSDTVSTDATVFDFDPIKSPLDAHAHYVQEEDPRVFTTQSEQSALQTRNLADPNADNYWTRVTFNWNHVHEIAYQSANKIEFFYRQDSPLVVKGVIESVIEVSGEDALLVSTKAYKEISSESNIEVSPSISAGDESKFVGSWLVVEGDNYLILDVTQGTNGPIFKVETSLEVVQSKDSLQPGLNSPLLSYKKPNPDTYILATENLLDENNWTKLDKTVNLVSFSNRQETIQEPGGDTVTYSIGGLEGNAIVIDDPSAQPVEGLYKVTFDSTVLSDHPQKNSEHVDWYQGVLRAPTNNGDLKVLKVLSIESQNPLVIWALDSDPSSSTEPNAIKTDATTSVDVNFHPGYRLYLEPEASNSFEKDNIIPANNDSMRKSLLAIRAIDDSDSNNVKRSQLSNPMTIIGLNIKEPQKPSSLIGPSYSNRPDVFGKASFTFDVETTQEPFSIAVYRGHEFGVLEAMYEEETIEDIYQALGALESNTDETQRFSDLVNVVFDADPAHQGEWKEYNGYRLPNPDLSGLLNGSEPIQEKEDKLRQAVVDSFIPVIEKPLIYEFLETGTTTSSDSPVISDKNGHLIDFGNSAFKPFPFARKFTSAVDSKPYLRFTDYNLDGASQNLYFYFAVEITRELKISEPSTILGPIRIVNSFPPEKPNLKSVTTLPGDSKLGIPANLRFAVNQYLPEENISGFRLYRTTSEVLSSSVELMDFVGEFTLSEPIDDLFGDLPYPPFNQDLFYRIVALREILNEQDELELVPSVPSEVINTIVVDEVNPPAPIISSSIGSTTSGPNQLHNVDLSWTEQCFEGKYRLYKLSESGQWEEIQTYNHSDSLTFNFALLEKEDASGNEIFHRFKVVTVNSSELESLNDKIHII